MILSRNITLWLHFFFDHCLPPVLRDQKWFMWLPFKLLFGDKSEYFFSFKALAHTLSPLQMRDFYSGAADAFISRKTDLNKSCIDAIEKLSVGSTVLDVACGRGFLSTKLSERFSVTAADFVIESSLLEANANIAICRTNLEELPFADRQFDTVVCAHTLEHVQDPVMALKELRRVCAQRLLIVLPRQRPYRYTFDLHLHFFPYEYDVWRLVGKTDKPQRCQLVGGDWMYVEG